MRQTVALHARDHVREGADPMRWYIPYSVKIYGDARPNRVADRAWVFGLDADLYGMELASANGYVTTPGSGSTQVMIRNETQDVDILLSPIVIPASSLNDLASPGVPDPVHRVAAGDQIQIQVVAVGAGSKGLGINLQFRVPSVDLDV